MKRISPVLAVLGAVLASAPAGAAAPRGRVEARLTNCHHAVTAFDRRFDVAAKMRAVPGTRRMGIRFDLLELGPGATRFAAVSGGAGFGEFLLSDRKVGSYRYFRNVNNLDAPASYRMRVGFRWYGKRGRVLLTRWRLTRACRQPDPRPDLRVRTRLLPSGRYAVVVVNAGALPAGPFSVAIPTLGGPERLVEVSSVLAPGTVRRVGQTRACAGAIRADSGNAVDESDEDNNTRVVPCPAPTAP